MKRIQYILIAPLVASLISCSATANLYPVMGPLSRCSPLPVIKAVAGNVVSDSGPIELTMPNGEFCSGRWSVVAPKFSSITTGSSQGSVYSGLDHAFMQIHGTSITKGIQPGINHGQAMMTGNKGTVITMEFLVGSGTASGYGVAKDNHGNIYKVLF